MLHVGVCCAVMSVPCGLVVTCRERADLLAVVFAVFCHFPSCFLVHIRFKGEVGAVNWFKPSCKIFLMTVQGGTCTFVLFMYCVCLAFASVHCCVVVTRLEKAELFALVCDF